MKIAVGADHAGFEAKEELKKMLETLGHVVMDVGTHSKDSCDYPDYARRVAEAVANRQVDRGVLVCGTGIGMSMTANKVRGVRASLITDPFTSEMSRRHNDANVFCAGARVLDVKKMKSLLKLWLKTPFEGGRHKRRVAKIERP